MNELIAIAFIGLVIYLLSSMGRVFKGDARSGMEAGMEPLGEEDDRYHPSYAEDRDGGFLLEPAESGGYPYIGDAEDGFDISSDEASMSVSATDAPPYPGMPYGPDDGLDARRESKRGKQPKRSLRPLAALVIGSPGKEISGTIPETTKAAVPHRFVRGLATGDRENLRQAVVLADVLGPPRSLRDGGDRFL
jgi:hypothetical protein